MTSSDDSLESLEDDLDERLALVRDVIARTPDPLHVPLGLDFAAYDGDRWLADWRELARDASENKTHEPAVLYAHVPFCARVCSYCLLSARQTTGKSSMDAYVRAMQRQIDRVEPLVRTLRFSTLHVGGGTPTILSEPALDALLSALARLRRTENFSIGVEAHPSTATREKMELLSRHGVHRVSFGVETMTEPVLRAVQRGDQTAARVIAAVENARRASLSVNVDVLAGLPGETEESFAASLRDVLRLEPDSMSVNRFLGENSPLAREGRSPLEADDRIADRMLLSADAIVRETRPPRWPDRPLETPGFGTQYVWDRSDRARPYFQQDMIGPTSTLALGHGALGHVHGRHFSVAAGELHDWVDALERDRAPTMLAAPIDPRFEMAFDLSDRLCRGPTSMRDVTRVFHADPRRVFGPELAHLVARGLLIDDGDAMRKRPDRSFQVTHLLSFLLFSCRELRAMRRSIPDGAVKSAEIRQYESIGAELPPSLLWCRIAIRASVSAKGAAPIAIKRPDSSHSTSAR